MQYRGLALGRMLAFGIVYAFLLKNADGSTNSEKIDERRPFESFVWY